MSNLYGDTLFGEPVKPPSKNTLSERFTVPPFSVLNARDGFWQDRKRRWISYGIDGEVASGRKNNLLGAEGKDWGTKYDGGGCWLGSGTSIFDPVLCELMYSWFCPNGGLILDPFAGGSVRGIVASLLGFDYYGIDLRQEQIDANVQQGNKICEKPPTWICGDSLECVDSAPFADFVFSCPPYGDLEIYSDDPRDISNMEYHTFISAMKRIILKSCARLKQNRFACFVVGDFRDKRGFYRNFVSDTIQGFLDSGLFLYNEAILITSVGSLPIRVTKQFNAGRKLGKTHQNVLVFCKGDPFDASKLITK